MNIPLLGGGQTQPKVIYNETPAYFPATAVGAGPGGEPHIYTFGGCSRLEVIASRVAGSIANAYLNRMRERLNSSKGKIEPKEIAVIRQETYQEIGVEATQIAISVIMNTQEAMRQLAANNRDKPD